jgi:hypothetical protein
VLEVIEKLKKKEAVTTLTIREVESAIFCRISKSKNKNML